MCKSGERNRVRLPYLADHFALRREFSIPCQMHEVELESVLTHFAVLTNIMVGSICGNKLCSRSTNMATVVFGICFTALPCWLQDFNTEIRNRSTLIWNICCMTSERNLTPLYEISLRCRLNLRNISSSSSFVLRSSEAFSKANNSTHLVEVWSTMKINLLPSKDSGSGPKRSIAIVSNLGA